jgi:hypothetical protein
VTVEALRLRPDSDTLEGVRLEHDAVTDTHLQSVYVALGVQLVDVIRLTDEIDLWCDDEGRINSAESNPVATSMCRAFGWHLNHGDEVRGAVLFAGHDGQGGMASLTDRQRAILDDALAQALRM